MDILQMLEDYKKCVDICSKINYIDKKTVIANNKAVKKMYSILKKIKIENSNDIKIFYELLDNEMTGRWFSHQLLELFKVDSKIEKKALNIIKKLSKNNIGQKYWLKNYKIIKRKNGT
jgi:Txe/YoeB family toxin of Txe-Axe toxin-antitoxin module